MNTPTQVMWRVPTGSVALDTVMWRKRAEFIDRCTTSMLRYAKWDAKEETEWVARRYAAHQWEKRR